MINKYLEWSLKVNLQLIGNLDMSKYDQLKTLMCEGYCNVDLGYRPVYIIRAKYLKASEVFEKYTEEDLIQYYV